MAKVLSLKQALKGWIFIVLAILVMFFGGQLAEHLTRDATASTAVRSLGVGVAIAATIPWVLIIVRAIEYSDEYVQRVSLVGTVFAFVADLLVHIGFNAALDARLVSWSTHLLPLPMAIGLWLLGVTIAALYYRYRP